MNEKKAYFNKLLDLYNNYSYCGLTKLTLYEYSEAKFDFCCNLIINSEMQDILDKYISGYSKSEIASKYNVSNSRINERIKIVLFNFFDLYTSLADSEDLNIIRPITSIKALYYMGKISSKTKNTLIRAGFYNINDLIEYYLAFKSLRGIKDLGTRSYTKLYEIIAEFTPCEVNRTKASKTTISIDRVADIIYNNYDKLNGLSKNEISLFIKESC